MTAREKLNSIIEINRKDLYFLKRMGVFVPFPMMINFTFIIILILIGIGINNFIRIPLILICIIPLLFRLWIKKRMKKLECPKCNKNLDYLFLGRDYNPQCDYSAFPLNIKQCPFCKFDLDGETD